MKAVLPRIKKATNAGVHGKVKINISRPGMVAAGFDTEGVSATPKSGKLKIQCALVLAGVSYAFDVPVDLKVSSDKTIGQIAGRSGR